MATLISMELTSAEAKQEVQIDSKPPKYPWGLSLNLDAETLKKLGIDTLPEVGATMSIIAKAEVQSASTSQYQGDSEKQMNLSLQITDLAMAPAAGDATSVLYDAK